MNRAAVPFCMICLSILPVAPSFAALADLKINEVNILGPGTDSAEFIELYDGGTLTDLTGVEVRLHNGGSVGAPVYRAISLSGTMPADGYLVIGPTGTPNLDVDTAPALTTVIENGPADAVVLYDTLGSANIDAVQYATEYDTSPGNPENANLGTAHREGNPAGINGDDTVNAMTGTSTVVARTNIPIGRFPDGNDTGDNHADFRPLYGGGTPGTSNSAGVFGTIVESFDVGVGLTGEWIQGFSFPVLEVAGSASSQPAFLPPSPDPISPNSFLSVKEATGAGEQMLLGKLLATDYDVFADFYLGALITPSGAQSEFGGLFARSNGADHQVNNTMNAFIVSTPTPVYGPSFYRIEIDYGTGIVSAVSCTRSVRTVHFSSPAQSTGWHTLGIRCNGAQVVYFLDGTPLHTLSSETPRAGYVGIGYRESMTGTGAIRCNVDNFRVAAAGTLPVEVDSFGVD